MMNRSPALRMNWLRLANTSGRPSATAERISGTSQMPRHRGRVQMSLRQNAVTCPMTPPQA